MSSPPQAEGRSSPCRDVTHPAGADSTATAVAGGVSATTASGDGDEGETRTEDINSQQVKLAQSNGTEGPGAVATVAGSNDGADNVVCELVAGQDASNDAASSTARAAPSSVACDGDQRNVNSTRRSDKDQGRLIEVDGKAKCSAVAKRTVVH